MRKWENTKFTFCNLNTNATNPEDLPEYIQPFIHLFNKKKFKKLLE